MLQHFNKNKKERDVILEKNLKLMSMSAIILLALFIYTMYKSSANINSVSYYVGLIFLFILMFFAILIRFYKDKIRAFFSKNTPFEAQLQKASHEQSNSSMQQSHEQSSIESVTSNITFKDIAGISCVKEELEEVVDFLNAPKKYLKHGVKLPKGVLLIGPPGVGKTLIARAVAGEAQVPFFYQSGASFVHIYVGMGAKRVKELFSKAKAHAPSIIFIDEIDAVGKQRSGSSNDEREATLNELLTQMDGFEGESGVMVIAATNKIEVLDDALLRAGRFDRRVFVSLPNVQDREKILELYLKNKSYEFDVRLLAQQTSGFSSAALATLINEALLNMIKRNAKILSLEDIEVAKTKVEFGIKQKLILDEKQKEILATYQASKAFISKQKTTLFEQSSDFINEVFPSKSQLLFELRCYLSGSVGVEVILGEPFVVNKSDIKKAYELAHNLVHEYKMANETEILIQTIKEELISEIFKSINTIEQLKQRLLQNEVLDQNEL
jgi:ATP-dependent metalloprotease FtsH